jgi:hypothetical protein
MINMDIKNKKYLRKIYLIMIVLSLNIFSISFLYASPIIINPTYNTMFNLTQDEPFTYLINAISLTNSHPIYFTDTSKDPDVNFSCFLRQYYNETSTFINFTPNNNCVGLFQFFIIGENIHGSDSLRLRFNVSNVNDPPYIISFYPIIDPVIIDEGQNITFFINTTDDDLIYGDLLSYEWLFNNESVSHFNISNIYNTPLTNVNATFISDFNRFEIGDFNISVIVSDLSGAKVRKDWNLTINNVNRPPENNKTFQNIITSQDNNLIDNLSLREYFYDPDTNGTLCDLKTNICLNFSYKIIDIDSIYSLDDPFFNGTVNISITEDGNVSFLPKPYWYGIVNMSFYVYDGYVNISGNNFLLNITNVNDPPFINHIPNQTTYGYVNFYYQVDAFDIDNDTITYSLLSPTFPLINIDSTSGLINATSNSTYFGNHTIIVNVSDGELHSTEEFNLEIIENFPPIINPISNISFEQYDFFNLVVSGFDPYSENITFFSNSTFINISERINSTYWNFTFYTPLQSDVGNHSTRIYANDSYGAISYYDFNIEIIDKFMPPILLNFSWENYRLRIGKEFVFRINATDEDYDIDSFSINFTDENNRFNISTTILNLGESAQGLINWTPTVVESFEVNISINDSKNYYDSKTFIINVTNNHAPYFTNLQNFIIEENILFDSFFLSANDLDWQDRNNLIFSNNFSAIDPSFLLDPITGLINWTPSTQGIYLVEVNVTDGDLITTGTIQFNVTEINMPPEFINLSINSNWFNITENSTSYFYIEAKDRENESLSFTVEFLNFTNRNGSIFYSNIDLFNLSEPINLSNIYRVYINTTPSWNQVGKYYVRFNVTDGNSLTSEIINFTVININNPPFYNWSLECRNSSNEIQSSLFSNLTSSNFNCIENMTLYFRISLFDPDFDNLSVMWNITDIRNEQKYNGFINNSNNYFSINYTIPFDGYPNMTLNTKISDGIENINISINLNITNVNRPVTFGLKEYVFSLENGVYNNTLINEDLLTINNTGIFPNYGYYISDAFDFYVSSPSSVFNITNISFFPEPQINNFMSYYTTSKQDLSLFFNSWDDYTFNNSISINNRYLYFRIDYNLSDINDYYNNFSSAKVNYVIPDKTINPSSDHYDWINLDNYFKDLDYDDIITYNYTIISGEGVANISISHGKFVRILSIQDGGSMEFFFSAKDNHNSTALSNNITLLIESSPPITIPSGGGGGGVSSNPITQYRTRNVDRYVSLDMIHPESITIYENETIFIPLIIKNNENISFENIRLKASVDREGLNIFLNNDYIPIIQPDENITIYLTLNMTKVYDSYGITIFLNSSNPSYQDSTKIMVSSLIKGRDGEETETIKLAFVSDLLTKNPECQELSEYINRARLLFEQGSINEGMILLDNFINDCKFLISSKEPLIDSPKDISDYLKIIRKDSDTFILIITIIIVVFGTFIGIFIIKYKKI